MKQIALKRLESTCQTLGVLIEEEKLFLLRMQRGLIKYKCVDIMACIFGLTI